MKSIQNAMLTVGLMHVPVGIAPAVTKVEEVSFKNIHEKCMTPLKVKTVASQAKTNGKTPKKPEVSESAPALTVIWCETCKKEVVDDVTKGYEFAKGQFVQFSEEEIEAAKGGRNKAIEITKIVKRDDLNQKLVNNMYFLVPNAHVNSTYGVLYQALVETKSVAIGRQSVWGKEYPCAIVPDQSYASGGVLMMLLLHCAEDLVEPDFSAPIPKAADKKLAKEMLNVIAGKLEPDDLTSRSRSRVQEMIAARVEGLDLPEYETEREAAATTDIQETLRKSIEVLQGQKPKAKAKAKA